MKNAKEDLQSENILKGVAIQESEINSKLGKALTKFIQIYAPNHIETILNAKQ